MGPTDSRIATDCRLDLAATTNYFWYVDVNSKLITASLEARQATHKQLGSHENTLWCWLHTKKANHVNTLALYVDSYWQIRHSMVARTEYNTFHALGLLVHCLVLINIPVFVSSAHSLFVLLKYGLQFMIIHQLWDMFLIYAPLCTFYIYDCKPFVLVPPESCYS